MGDQDSTGDEAGARSRALTQELARVRARLRRLVDYRLVGGLTGGLEDEYRRLTTREAELLASLRVHRTAPVEEADTPDPDAI